MRTLLFAGFLAALSTAVHGTAQDGKSTPKDTSAASSTRTKLLKAKVTVDSRDERLGEILKEFAAQVDMKADEPVMWSYGPGFPYEQKITFAVADKPLDEALDLLLTKAGGGLGYHVVSRDGDKYDGWVRLTTTGERGIAQPPPTAEEEALAATRLEVAKKLIAAGKPASAKPVLEILARKYATTKAGMEARLLLEKIDK
jgi:hypothetical protein